MLSGQRSFLELESGLRRSVTRSCCGALMPSSIDLFDSVTDVADVEERPSESELEFSVGGDGT